MPLCHKQTEHSYESVHKNARFLDWRTQPSSFKSYPEFYHRVSLSKVEALKNLELMGKITYEKTYAGSTYTLRTNPSAGALYPCEIYVQIRGVKGVISGIYHYEPRSGSLSLLNELTNDGVEHYFSNQNKQQGFVFLISSAYFRSSWKYANRSIRYIFLDAGHCLGAIYASLCIMDRESIFEFEFDKEALNKVFNFRDDEMFSVALTSSVLSDTIAKEIQKNFAYVIPSNYLEKNDFIENTYKQTSLYSSKPIENVSFFKGISKEALTHTILSRRSIRAFFMHDIEKEAFNFIIDGIFIFASSNNIEIYYTIHRVKDKTEGLYKEDELIAEGDFSMRSRYLALEQNLGGQSAVTFYFTSNEKVAYQKVNILSGFLSHIIYLRCTLKNIGCSGIGAYYDQETQKFLKTENNILYMLAIGR